MIRKKPATAFEERFERYLRGEMNYDELHRVKTRAQVYRVEVSEEASSQQPRAKLVPADERA